jgi:hypothetical protein
MRKNPGVLAILIAGLLILTSCAGTKSKPLTYWYGTKAEIKAFLDNPKALSDKWAIYAIDD